MQITIFEQDTDGAIFALECQRAILDALELSIDGANIDCDNWLLLIKLCQALGNHASAHIKQQNTITDNNKQDQTVGGAS